MFKKLGFAILIGFGCGALFVLFGKITGIYVYERWGYFVSGGICGGLTGFVLTKMK